MNCIFCGCEKTTVRNTAKNQYGDIFRRRVCNKCRERFYTKEIVIDQTELSECREAMWKRDK